jgi:hypothetical protein
MQAQTHQIIKTKMRQRIHQPEREDILFGHTNSELYIGDFERHDFEDFMGRDRGFNEDNINFMI